MSSVQFFELEDLPVEALGIDLDERSAAHRLRFFEPLKRRAAGLEIFGLRSEILDADADVVRTRSPVVQIEARATVPLRWLDHIERCAVRQAKRHLCAAVALAWQRFDRTRCLPIEIRGTTPQRLIQVANQVAARRNANHLARA